MKISLNWLKQYIDFDLSNDELNYLLTDIGLEVESIEPFESVKGGLKGLVVGHVLEKEKHTDADKLSVCKVDVGTEVLQIVCGAPNVAAGQKVIVALVGTQLFPTTGEPFEIKKAKIRGIESSGMICAEDEIGTGTSHDGIKILPADTVVGSSVAELFGVESDYVIEIGLTPNRTDAFSHIGVARDLAAALSFRNKTNFELKLPVSNLKSEISNLKSEFSVEVENKIAAPKYLGIIINNLKVEESPKWLQNRLKAIGQKSINNIVDITNYVLHEFGQPLHAFDLNAIKGNKIVVKNLPAKIKFTALDNSVIELHEEDLMICDGEGNPMCMAGVYGGLHSGVKNETTAIFLECAYFDPKTIRRTSTRHGLKTDAASHFEKGIDPNNTEKVLLRAAQLIEEIADGKIATDIIYPSGFNHLNIEEFFKIDLEISNVKRLTGADISLDDIKMILSLLEIKIESETSTTLQLLIPPYRTDVTREADVIEDILRIYGFNNVVIPSKINASINFTNPFDADKLYNKTADTLVDFGFFEMMNNSISKSKYQEKLKNLPPDNWVRLLSSINTELDVMRNNMLFSGLESVAHNINHKNSNVKLFEFGKTYTKEITDSIPTPIGEGNVVQARQSIRQYNEKNHLAIFISGNKSTTNWNTPNKKTDFYYIKSIVDTILGKIGIATLDGFDNELSEIFDYSLVYKKGEKQLVEFGKVNTKFCKYFDIKQDLFFADINWDLVCMLAKKVKNKYQEISKFPSVKRDLALLIDKTVKFDEVKSIAIKFGKKILRNIELFDIYEDEKIGKDKKSYAVSFTFKDESKTLQDAEIESVMNKLIEEFNKQLNAEIR